MTATRYFMAWGPPHQGHAICEGRTEAEARAAALLMFRETAPDVEAVEIDLEPVSVTPLRFAGFRRAFWFAVYNILAHPLLATRAKWADRFHDWTGDQMGQDELLEEAE